MRPTGLSLMFLCYFRTLVLSRNRHRKRRYRQGIRKCGQSFLLHHMPHAFDAVDYGLEINEDEVNIFQSELDTMPRSPCSELIEDL